MRGPRAEAEGRSELVDCLRLRLLALTKKLTTLLYRCPIRKSCDLRHRERTQLKDKWRNLQTRHPDTRSPNPETLNPKP